MQPSITGVSRESLDSESSHDSKGNNSLGVGEQLYTETVTSMFVSDDEEE